MAYVEPVDFAKAFDKESYSVITRVLKMNSTDMVFEKLTKPTLMHTVMSRSFYDCQGPYSDDGMFENTAPQNFMSLTLRFTVNRQLKSFM